MIKTEITKKDLRGFALVLGLVLLVAGFFQFKKGHMPVSQVFLAIGGISVFMGIIMPGIMAPFYHIFAKVAHAIGWVNTRIILVLIYFVLIVPIGVVMKVFGKDLLDKKFKDGKNSYWRKRGDRFATKESLERQY